MSKLKSIAEWLMQCPALSNVWNISATEQDGATVLIPSGTSYRRNIVDSLNVDGSYEAEFKYLPSVYEEFQINCYRTIAENENEFNALNYDEVESVIEWITKQDLIENFPASKTPVVAVETFPFLPQVRGVDPDTGLICYYITLRVTYINTHTRKPFEWKPRYN